MYVNVYERGEERERQRQREKQRWVKCLKDDHKEIT